MTTKTSCKDGESIETAFLRSLEALGLDYVDLYLIHHPFWAKSPADQPAKWAEMEAIKASGRARSIGVSNYLQKHLEPILATAKSPPVVNQIEYHPYLQHGDLVAWHKEKGIALEAYAPLTAITKVPGGPVDVVYDRLAAKYGVSAGDVALRWCLDQDIVVLTTSASEQRLQGYLKTLPSFNLAVEEIGEISAAGRGKHYRGFWKQRIAEDDHR